MLTRSRAVPPVSRAPLRWWRARARRARRGLWGPRGGGLWWVGYAFAFHEVVVSEGYRPINAVGGFRIGKSQYPSNIFSVWKNVLHNENRLTQHSSLAQTHIPG